jgi:multidrug efflux pump
MRIQANPQALAAYGLALADLRTAVVASNVSQPKGTLDGPVRSTTIDANDQLRNPADYRDLIVAYRNEAPLRLGDIAEVVLDAEDSRLAAWANQQPAILLNVQRQPGANVIEVVDRIHKLLPQLRTALPGNLDVTVMSDRTQTIRASVKDVQVEMLIAIGLVVLVTFVFLRTLTATLIPSVVVPLSLIGTFGIMYLMGFSINNLTLMALTIATGFVVDDAIVMIENIARYLERGEKPLQAALKGASQIGFTLVSLTLSLIAVLIPLLFMTEVVGRLFREFALTLAVAIFLSLIISLTLTPMMCARLLRAGNEQNYGWIARKTHDWIEALIRSYARGLNIVLRHQTLTLFVALATFVLTALLYLAIPKGFFPAQDTGLIQVVTQAPQNLSFDAMSQRQQEAVGVILKDPAVESVASFIGIDGINEAVNTGRMQIALRDQNERQENVTQVIRRLENELSSMTGLQFYFQPVQDLTVEDRVSRTQYQMTLEAADPSLLAQWVPKLVDQLRVQPELTGVVDDLQEDGLNTFIHIDRDAAARLGVSTAAIDDALYDAFGQRQISTIFTQSNQYRVVIEVPAQFRRDPSSLGSVYVKSNTGKPIALNTIVKVTEGRTTLVINRLDQFPSVTISFNLSPQTSLSSAVEAVTRATQEIGMPPGIQTRFQGAARAFEASLSSTLLLILAAIITMYIVLGVLYESFIHPVTILSTLPSAAIGALLALLMTGRDLDMIGIIGIILLIGIVKKNAIMMIDFALDAERKSGLSPREAIEQAALLRFRPILMTTLAALFGAIPLMLSTGTGAELRQPLGLVMVGGLLVSQVLTLFTTPVIYLFFDRLLSKRKRSPDARVTS